jgi:hypothetical protein
VAARVADERSDMAEKRSAADVLAREHEAGVRRAVNAGKISKKLGDELIRQSQERSR